MSETKWTPGPWKAYELDPDDPTWEACEVWPSDNDREQEEGESKPVATMVCGVANAQLVAAAPELYSALEALLRRAADELADPQDLHEISIARAALAKARGEQP